MSLEEKIKLAKESANFDIDFVQCDCDGVKSEINHSPSTEGINLFNPQVGLKFLRSIG
jgi:hypothetical protein